jgi:hypothetical protein
MKIFVDSFHDFMEVETLFAFCLNDKLLCFEELARQDTSVCLDVRQHAKDSWIMKAYCF